MATKNATKVNKAAPVVNEDEDDNVVAPYNPKVQKPVPFRVWDKEGNPVDVTYSVDAREMVESGHYFAENPKPAEE